ncbi:MAG: molybdopterin oxidoreductase [Tistrella sp.]|uniref:TAT-variant-translocated molybdopterin oxidoreductase n=1 Tax=Tistrella sp. TaxID=2024861 RepID=UPI000C49AC36|nr:TAT-variant-translocated molybdopterin oxidoreductase [Tistrella sp.]MAD36577.1 molybdopterin oxidoreductase [Tistrella sp.]MBA75684.1 molybdopterin oxidoreductase [Tistrella sp.]
MSATGDTPKTDATDAAARLRGQLHGKTGRVFWRSLDELTAAPGFREAVATEFPGFARLMPEVDRRSVLKAMAASLALAGFTGCEGESDEAALPYVNAPEFMVPGEPRWYATAVTLCGYAQPVLGKTHVGRPVKLEGNPDHPATRGGTDPFLQAALLDLYDPDRSAAPLRDGRPVTWAEVDRALARLVSLLDGTGGEGFRLLTGTVTSPTLARQIGAMQARWPGARWHVFEPLAEDGPRRAAALAFGRPLDRQPALEAAEVVVALDDDLLGPGPHQIVTARRWAERRRDLQAGAGDSRLMVAEPVPSLTGTRADARLVTPARRIGRLAVTIAAELGVGEVPATGPALTARERDWAMRAARALAAAGPRGLFTVGPRHPAEVQALAFLVNARTGALGQTLRFTEPVAALPPAGSTSFDRPTSFDQLVDDMAAGRVTTLAVLGANPAYAAPAGSGFGEAAAQVGTIIHAGLHVDETAAIAGWHLPLAHELESWSDARAVDGTVSIIQPLVRPFHDVRGRHRVLAGLTGILPGGAEPPERAWVMETWRQRWGAAFEDRWRAALLAGLVEGTAAPEVRPDAVIDPPAVADEPVVDGLSVVFGPDPTIWDGRFADNAWLQETPKPANKVTWTNVIGISPALAAARGLKGGDVVTLSAAGRSLQGPVWITPGQEADTVSVTFGYGRRKAGRVGQGIGYDAFAIRPHGEIWHVEEARLQATGASRRIATTQAHQAMDGFDFVRTVPPDAQDISHHRATPGPKAAEAERARAPTFYPVRESGDGPSWAMAIDLDLCIGCNACVVACVAENNVAMVGEDLVAEGREMHWLRVDHYHEGDPAEPRAYFQPVPCMHCEQAPCEMGCPVNATVHSSEGLNVQIYNRCIGTRTCSSFCPYKVRRFNWFDYTGDDPEELRAMRNPDVTVRDRGVMEKCTYCVQRISDARIKAKIDGRPIGDGEVVTACQQACPTRAITFGNIADPGAEVTRQKTGPRNYALLEEANTWPRTTYLARIEEPDETGPGETAPGESREGSEGEGAG